MVRVRLWILWYAQWYARSIGGGDRKWVCTLRVQSRPFCTQQLPSIVIIPVSCCHHCLRSNFGIRSAPRYFYSYCIYIHIDTLHNVVHYQANKTALKILTAIILKLNHFVNKTVKELHRGKSANSIEYLQSSGNKH